MSYILFMNPCYGVDYTLKKKMEREAVEYTSLSIFGTEEEKELYTKHGIRTTPVLLVLDNDIVVDRIVAVSEIVDYLKNVSDTKISVGD